MSHPPSKKQRLEVSVADHLLEALKSNIPPTMDQAPKWIEQFQSLPLALHEILQKYSKSISPPVLAQFVEAWPHSLTKKDASGLLPLHIAWVSNAPLEIVQILTEKYPEALTEIFKNTGLFGKNAILLEHLVFDLAHEMGNENSNRRILEYICENFPILACTRFSARPGGTKQDMGANIFHDQCSFDVQSLEAMAPLIRHRPELLTSKVAGQTVLHLACFEYMNSSHIAKILEKCPELVHITSRRCGYGWDDELPLHACLNPLGGLIRREDPNSAAFHANNQRTIKLLTQAFPDSIKMKINGGQLPLDMLTGTVGFVDDAPLQAYLPYLVDNAVQPLHFYFRVGGGGSTNSVGTLNWLINSYPGHLILPDANGDLPLHLAIKGRVATRAVMQKVLAACPDACSIPDSEGNLPLHLALGGAFTEWQVLDKLVGTFPGSASNKDPEGWLPFMLAAKNNLGFQNMQDGTWAHLSLTMTFHLLQLKPVCLLQSVREKSW